MVKPIKKRLALDTNLLFDLAGNSGMAHDFREVCQERGYSMWLPPTALGELVYFSGKGTVRERELAMEALKNLLWWKIFPMQLDDLDRHVAKRFSKLLRDRGLLPEKEDNDGRILGETATGEIPLLVTSDRHLLDMDRTKLEIAFADSELPITVVAVSPRSILKALRGRR
jgi:hypothetical protein